MDGSQITPFPTLTKGKRYRALPREEQIRLGDLSRAGDLAAREQLIVSVLPWIFTHCQAVPPKFQTTNDEYQAVLLRVWEALVLFDGRKGAISTFVSAQCYWTLQRMRYRERFVILRPHKQTGRDNLKANRLHVAQLEESLQGCPGRECQELQDIDHKLMVGELRSAVDELPQRERAVVRLRLQGNTLTKIGMRMGLSKERVRQLESRAYERLRSKLKKWSA